MGATFLESDRVKIRKWLGFSALFLQADPRLEAAITSVQSVTDNGTRPDDSTVLAIKDYLTKLDGIETQWMNLTAEGGMQGGKIDELQIDPLRGLEGLKKVGRIYVGFLADALSTRPHRDVFSAPKLLKADGEAGPFPEYDRGYPQW